MNPSLPSPPIIPETAPFTPEQRAWLNGFLAGVLARENAAGLRAPAAPSSPAAPLTILFGSQTGTAERLAKQAAKAAGQRGFAPAVVDMASANVAGLAGAGNLLVVTSTYGDGEPPDNAKTLFAELAAATSDLSQVKFSVCGLGDSSYAQFCQAGKELDQRLAARGAVRAAPRADCDVEYEKPFLAWLETALAALGGGPPAVAERRRAEDAVPAEYGRSHPFPAPLIASRVLNGEGSDKEVRHVEISLEGSGLVYTAGDALGVQPQNGPELVEDVLRLSRCDGEEEVQLPDGSAMPFRRALTERCDLGRPLPEFLARVAGPAASAPGDGEAPLHVVDLLRRRPEARLGADELVRLLRPLGPRLYSISSSPKAHPGRVHLTVGVVRYDAHGRKRNGVCSSFLAGGAAAVPVFVHANPAFRLPADPDVPIIMIGPGTGIAPFRGFLHERRAMGARGRCWLFFGDRRSSTDFLYADEIAAFQRDAVLTRLDTAFSRDQEAKAYVQHRMLERASELHAWLEEGAHVYVCGDASRMARDVDAALHTALEQAGKSADEARAYVGALRAAKRYVRDVY